MGHVGRVPTNFGDNRNQVYLVPQLKQLAVTIRWTRDLQTWMSQWGFESKYSLINDVLLYYFPGKLAEAHSLRQCSRKRVQQLKKNVKSHVFWNLKKRKKRKKRRPTYSFTGRSITQPLILNYRNRNPVPVQVSHQHHTPCSEMRTQETNMQLTCRSVIVKLL